jgi:oxygen-dependent protoporphyrinogen oxidase
VLVDRTLAELRAVLGTDRLGVRRPDLVGVWRCREAIPQYERGHEARVRAVEATAATLPGLHVTGASLRGVGINDCIRNATALAARLAAAP